MRLSPSLLLSGYTQFLAKRSPSDRAIVIVLSGLLAIAALVVVLSLVRLFQVAVPAQGGVLYEGVVGAPRFPHPLIATTDADRDIVALTYAGLMGHSGDGSIIPVLAEGYTRSEDGLVYTFVLREGLEFSDGTPVTVDDILFTVARVQDPDLMSPLLSRWTGVRAEALDSRTVQFTLPRAYAPFIEDTTLGILPRHLWESVENTELPFSPYTTEPVGAGPFTLDRVVRDSDGSVIEYRLHAFSGYALGRPYLDRISLLFYENQAALRAAIDSREVTSAAGAALEQTIQAPYARVFATFFNESAYASLESRAVREALSLAIDRDAIVNEIFGGYATPITGPLPPAAIGTSGQPEPHTRQLEKARALLTEAGWEFNEQRGLWTDGDRDLLLTLTTSSNPELRAVAGRIETDWEALGIPTEIVLFDPTELAQEAIRPREYHALLFGEIITHPADLYAFWSSTEREDPGLNITQFGDAAIDAELTALRNGTSADPASAAAGVASAIAAAYPAAFLYTPHFLYGVPDTLRGVSLHIIASPADRFHGVHKWHRYTEWVWSWFVR